MLILTVAEIKDLAECAGLVLDKSVSYEADELETEIVIMACPKEGVRDDDGKPTHYAHIAYFGEYPEEGSYPLGDEVSVAKPYNPDEDPAAGNPWPLGLDSGRMGVTPSTGGQRGNEGARG